MTAEQASVMRPVVVGAGWSGLACAISLVQRGHRPLVLDAAPHAGGRARSFTHALGGAPAELDNGQHLLLGGYRATLDLMQTVGVDCASAFARSPFALTYPDGWRLAAANLPAPLHLAAALVGARGPTLAERWSLTRWSLRHARTSWRHQGPDSPAAALFSGEPAGLVRRLWRPLCLAALNVELEDASAHILLNVLRDSLGARAGDSALLVPRVGLSRLFPEAAIAWLRAHGAEVQLHSTVTALELGNAGAGHALQVRGERVTTGSIVLALPADRAADLLTGQSAALDPALRMLRAVRFAPIATVYLRYAAGTRLVRPVMTLQDDPRLGHHGQWAFDRGALDPAMDGIVSVVISGAGPYRALDRDALGQAVALQLRRALGLPAPLAPFAITEKHATIVPAPGLRRPAAALPVAGLYLAGDAADSPYPSTIEGSVRAGMAAAAAIGRPPSTSTHFMCHDAA